MIRPASAALLLGPLLLTACGAPPPAPDPDAPAIAWAASVCRATPSITAAPQQTPADLASFLDTLAAGLAKEAAAIRAAGPPPVPDGSSAVAKALATIDSAQESLHQARSRLAQVAPGDDAGLSQAVADVNTGMAALSDAGDPKTTLRQNAALDRAFTKAEGC
ncbi:hypothetical protein [Kutzneria sp. CA-103260]|uniref:hypothetical protein n=1 Tax=Kutzneria sp. CA-103260 TaxID=2802641 RepID=UPI001BAE2499|nr:hypothetical protein [Kutzneria sp. CA-103260]QUQ68402.1 hypothetical protein JJ691_61470 [Kutzneria sp. CA-103260]